MTTAKHAPAPWRRRTADRRNGDSKATAVVVAADYQRNPIVVGRINLLRTNDAGEVDGPVNLALVLAAPALLASLRQIVRRAKIIQPHIANVAHVAAIHELALIESEAMAAIRAAEGGA